MADACRGNGVLLMEGFMYRLNPRTLAIKKAIDDGLLGSVRSVVIEFSFVLGTRDTYRDDSRLIPGKGAGAVMDVGCYCINFARHAFGEDPREVMAVQDIDEVSGGDMSTSAILDFGSGRTAVITCSFQTSYRNNISVTGDQAVLRAERFFTPLEEGKTRFTIQSSHGDAETREFDAVNQFLLEIEHFSDCVLGNSSVLLDPYADAVPNAAVIDAIRESARTGGRARVRG
jgi:predicted dehydrogenase